MSPSLLQSEATKLQPQSFTEAERLFQYQGVILLWVLIITGKHVISQLVC